MEDATSTPTAATLREASAARAELDSPEMDSLAQVRTCTYVYSVGLSWSD